MFSKFPMAKQYPTLNFYFEVTQTNKQSGKTKNSSRVGLNVLDFVFKLICMFAVETEKSNNFIDVSIN